MLDEADRQSTLTRSRLLQMMTALEATGGTPIDRPTFHAFAFFTNVLSPLWEIEPIEGSVLKDSQGPYYPLLQRELDCLVAAGFITIESIRPDVTGLEATYGLAVDRSASIMQAIDALPDERELRVFLIELASAFLEIKADRRDDAAVVDAAYSNPAISTGRVVDYAEWVRPTIENPSWNTAESFQKYMPSGVTLNRAEKLLMYMRLLKGRAHG